MRDTTLLAAPAVFTCDKTTVLFEGRPMSQMTVIRAKIRLRKEIGRSDVTERYRNACDAALAQLQQAQHKSDNNFIAAWRAARKL